MTIQEAISDEPPHGDWASYCKAARGHPIHGPYHDEEHGFPLSSDDAFFERFLLEINQAGLSWLTILKKREGFRKAYGQFRIETVAAFGEADRTRLLSDASIVRNRLKVDAAIHNAKKFLEIREDHGSVKEWLDHHHPRPRNEWVKLFRKNFRFTGGEITGGFLISTGYLPGAHHPGCPVFARVLEVGAPRVEAQ